VIQIGVDFGGTKIEAAALDSDGAFLIRQRVATPDNYAAAIQASVTQNWNRPDSAQAGLKCSINITQIPGGDVISVTLGSPCNADDATRNSIEQAVMKAAPLPYQGYEKVFQRSIKLNFKYNGEG
jgi:colicin import membrane protein